MTIVQRVAEFFQTLSDIWAVVPGPVKAILYAFFTSVIATYLAKHAVDWDIVIASVAANLGLYSAPKMVNSGVQKMAE